MEKRAKEGDARKRILISILSTVDTELPNDITNEYSMVVPLRFDDIELSYKQIELEELDEAYDGLTAFKAIHAATVAYRVKEALKGGIIDEIDVHCTAGVSRSGAVAVGIAMFLNDEKLMEETVMNNNILPNNYVLSMMHTHVGTHIHMPIMKIYSLVNKRMEMNKTKTILGGANEIQ
ncbi:MAG: hypothetical protein ACRDD8_16350 [Bacteroidales bacterium]